MNPMLTIRRCYILLTSIFLASLLSACSSKPTAITLPDTASVARSALFSNAILFPSDLAPHFYWPPTKSLASDIRAVGGEIYQSGSFVTIVLPDDALFEPASASLLPKAYTLIDDVAKIIVRFSNENVIITAHTDNIGAPLYQAKLSRQQAQLFAMVLWQNDSVDLKVFKRFKYAGMAGTRPITEDPSPHGQALNRRVQITIYPSSAMMDEYFTSQEVSQI